MICECGSKLARLSGFGILSWVVTCTGTTFSIMIGFQRFFLPIGLTAISFSPYVITNGFSFQNAFALVYTTGSPSPTPSVFGPMP